MTLFLRDSALGSAPGMITMIMSEAAEVKCGSPGAITVSRRLAKAIPELRRLQTLLLSGEDLDARILTDFRDALNHVRNTAWSAQQYIASQTSDRDSASVLSVLAGERVRVAYQLCQAIQTDLKSRDIKFQPGQLIQLSLAAKAMIEQLDEIVGEPK
jgi:hypothetical protein